MTSGDKTVQEEEMQPPRPQPLQIPYTRFSRAGRRYLVALLGYVTLASSLTATIYFPIIPLLATEFATSIQAINLTITVYVVFQALSPALLAPLSDSLGRRPVLLASLLLYTAAALGLALNAAASPSHRSYAALLALRGIQSLGGSAVVALAYGAAADVAPPAERGALLGPLLAATNLGPCAGPVVGGAVAYRAAASAACFWALLAFGAVALLAVGWGMPETGRAVVGNGAVPARGPWRTWWACVVGWVSLLWARRKSRRLLGGRGGEGVADARNGVALLDRERQAGVNAGKTGRGTLTIPNPLAPLRIVFYKDTFLTLWVAATVYTVWYCIQTSIPIVFGAVYHWSELQVGLSYLAGGSGVILGGFINGKLMDWNYRVVAGRAGHAVDRVSGDDMLTFPIERARSRGSILLFTFSVCAVVGYGWAIRYQVHPSVPLILQCLVGAEGTMIHQSFNALLVDIFPENPSTAAAAGNITRCGLSAAVVACIEPLVHALGYGWFFTLIGLASGSTGILAVIALRLWGWGWRMERAARECPGSGGSQ